MVGICFEPFLFDCSNDKMMNCTNLCFFNEISVLEKHFFPRLKNADWSIKPGCILLDDGHFRFN